MSREELTRLGAPSAATAAAPAPLTPTPTPASSAQSARPVLPPEARERFVAARADASAPVVLVPHLLLCASARYVHAKASLDAWLTPSFLVPFAGEDPDFTAGRLPRPETASSCRAA